MKLTLFSILLLVALSFTSCSLQNCDDVLCEPLAPCEEAMQFNFYMDSTDGFILSDVDTIQIIRYWPADTNQSDSLELYWWQYNPRNGVYQPTPNSPLKENIPWCDWLISPGIVINNEAPFQDSEYDFWNYDIILKNNRIIKLRRLNEIGELSKGCCGGYFSTTKEVEIDGVLYTNARFVTIK